jgi:hypothetical protein
MISRISIAAFLLFSSLSLAAQDVPDKIRGYKVYRPKISRTGSSRPANVEPVSLRGSKLVSISPLGVKFEVEMNIAPIPQDGRVDFLTFHDFRVNGIPVEIEEYTSPFNLWKNESITLPKPATVFLSTPRIAQAAWSEMRDSRAEWTVAGRVFVFGRFKKYGMTFKRVVPVDVSFTIKNPVS